MPRPIRQEWRARPGGPIGRQLPSPHTKTNPEFIVFDLSEVLIAGMVGAERVLSRRTGIPAVDLARLLQGHLLDELMRDEVTEALYFQRVIRRLNKRVSASDLRQAIYDNFAMSIPGTVELLPILARRHKLILHSDHAREWISYIKTVHTFFDYFSNEYYSFDLGALKRESGTFARVLRLMSASGGSCLLIDDNPANIKAAGAEGIPHIRFTSPRMLRRELYSLELIAPF